MSQIEESDLTGHIANGDNKKGADKKDSKKVSAKNDDEEPKVNPLAFKDYQLFTALNLLKGIAATK